MTLAVIGVGVGRTGTFSLKLALEQLGFGPCHHMTEVNGSEAQKAFWRAAARGETASWGEAYAGYRSAVDYPTAYFWRQLASNYPDARLILTTRDPDAWYDSVAKTISFSFGPENDPDSFGRAVIGEAVFGGRFADRAHAIAVYEAHNEAVRQTIPASRLLDYRVDQGWPPLCAFLGVPVPAEPFPHRNTTEEFLSRRG
jgi:hypothetical protein